MFLSRLFMVSRSFSNRNELGTTTVRLESIISITVDLQGKFYPTKKSELLFQDRLSSRKWILLLKAGLDTI